MRSSFFITIIVVLLVLSVGFIFFYRTQEAQDARIPIQPTDQALAVLEKLRSIKIDTTFFEDAAFRALVSIPATSLDTIEKGRANPFSVGRRGGAVPLSQNSTQTKSSRNSGNKGEDINIR